MGLAALELLRMKVSMPAARVGVEGERWMETFTNHISLVGNIAG